MPSRKVTPVTIENNRVTGALNSRRDARVRADARLRGLNGHYPGHSRRMPVRSMPMETLRKEAEGQQKQQHDEHEEFAFVRFTIENKSDHDDDSCVFLLRKGADGHMVVLTCSHDDHMEYVCRLFGIPTKCSMCLWRYARTGASLLIF